MTSISALFATRLAGHVGSVGEASTIPGGARGGGASHGPAKNWDRHVENMELLAGTTSFCALRDRILELADLSESDRVLDVGAGTGLLALACAPRVAHVSAVDISPAMCDHLEEKRQSLGIGNLEVMTDSATSLPLADGSVDVVLSNYCFHHLRDAEKPRALAEARRVLRPGGRLVFGDMMFAVSLANPRDRAVIGRLIRRMVARGPAGVLRVLKNAARHVSGRGEHPARAEWWRAALAEAGFTEIAVEALDHEGGIASARRP
ncbi:MAG: methyltransferase domain-containing protein [Acidobacteriota bacterium]|nr:methyltransferase domain-containing protein [Acidobacteriota bacterium]